jgi:hypothetical protein
MAEQKPLRVGEGSRAVENRPVEPSGIAAGWIPRALMVAAVAGIGGLMSLASPAARWLFDRDLLVWLLSGAALAVTWWFRNVVWPDDPRET